MENNQQCWHKEQDRKIIKFYRKNYPYGKKSESRKYNPPRMCKEVCERCGVEINRWKSI